MRLSKELQAFAEEAKKSDAYWFEQAKLAFAIALEKQRVAVELTYAAVAKKIGTSAAYISKVFRGDSNVTIETMVKLARATGGQLKIEVVDASTPQVVWNFPVHGGALTTSTSSTIDVTAANQHSYLHLLAA